MTNCDLQGARGADETLKLLVIQTGFMQKDENKIQEL